jgi:hypothetical protein
VDAQDHGGRVRKNRSFMVGFQGKAKRVQLAAFTDMLAQLKCAPVPWHVLLGGPLEELPREVPSIYGPRRDQKPGFQYEDTFFELYQKGSHDYPPNWSKVPDALWDCVRHLRAPSQELAHFVELSYDYPVTLGTPQFLDVNQSAKFAIPKSGKSAMSTDEVPTLLTSSILMARWQSPFNGKKEFRIISGEYLLRIMGMIPQAPVSAATAQMMAGNMFEGHAIAAVMHAFLYAIGQKVVRPPGFGGKEMPAASSAARKSAMRHRLCGEAASASAASAELEQ